MSIKNFLPNNYIIAFIVIPILTIIGFFLLKDFFLVDNTKEKQVSAIEKVASLIQTESQVKDTDKDGLRDWEERLHKTDINNPDTDGDGIYDGMEIRSGTDPLDPFNIKKKEVANKEAEGEEYNYRNDPNLNKTEILARDFLLKTLTLNDANLLNNKSAQETIIGEMLSGKKKFFKDRFKKEDLNIVVNSNYNTLAEIKRLAQKNKADKLENNVLLFALFLEKEDEKYLDRIEENIIVLDKFLAEAVKIKVNQNAFALFLEYLNNLDRLNQISKLLANFNTDPFSALDALNEYAKTEDLLRNNLRNLALYFEKKNI